MFEVYVSDELKVIYLLKLVFGEWCGIMNLIEFYVGLDVGVLLFKVELNGDGIYLVMG